MAVTHDDLRLATGWSDWHVRQLQERPYPAPFTTVPSQGRGPKRRVYALVDTLFRIQDANAEYGIPVLIHNSRQRLELLP